MRSVRFIVFSILLLFVPCSCSNSSIKHRLQDLDSIISEFPHAVLDSLYAIRPESLCPSDVAYYDLLLTIARDKTYFHFEDDSLINVSYEWYLMNQNDNYNLARAAAYKGIVRFRINPSDSSIAKCLHEAELKMMSSKSDDSSFLSLIYAYNGLLSYRENNWNEAFLYHKKAAELDSVAGKIQNLGIDCINASNSLIAGGRLDEAVHWIAKAENLCADFFLPSVKNNLCNTRSLYSYYTKAYDDALFWCRKWNPSPGLEGNKDNLLSDIFTGAGRLDSALFYKKKAMSNKRYSDSLYYHSYYISIAHLNAFEGDFEDAYINAQTAYDFLFRTMEHRSEQKILEIEKQYDSAKKDLEIERSKKDRSNLLFLICLLILTASASAVVLTVRHRHLQKELSLQKKMVEENSRVNCIVRATAEGMSRMISDLNVLANKSILMIGDDRVSSQLSAIISSARKTQYEAITQLMNREYASMPDSWRKVMESLNGSMFKTVFYLVELGYDNKDIAGLTGQTSASVRAIKSQIRKIIVSKNALLNGERSELNIFTV